MSMPDSIPQSILQYCAGHNLGDIINATELKGGIQSRVRRLKTSVGLTMILKQHPHAPANWYPLEAEGLKLLQLDQCPRVPEVYLAEPAFLLLEDLTDPQPVPLDQRYWVDYGRKLAQLHRHTNNTFGFSHDNYLGLMPQKNPQTTDGHVFFIENRVLHYLNQPLSLEIMTREDRLGVERLCDWIRKNVPNQPPSLLHGDLWTGNMIAGPNNQPAYIDPAVHYGWAEAELSLTRQFGGVPEVFYDAYREINPLEPGWSERLPIYELKEDLALIAQFGHQFDMLGEVRGLISRYL